VGWAVVGWLLNWRFEEFFRFTFLIMPRYKEWMDGIAFPIHLAPMWGFCALAAANLFQLARRFLDTPPAVFFRSNFLEVCLLGLSVFYFRAALGRADYVHASVNSWPVYVLAFRLLIEPWLNGRLARRAVRLAAVGLAGICLVQIPRAHLLAQNFPLAQPDARYLPASYLETAAVIRKNLDPGETFFTFTSEALWYYLVDLPCPSRFPVVWFAAPPFYQEEIIRDLERNNTKLVLYRNQAPSNQIDRISNEQRLPLLAAHLKEKYEPWRTVKDHQIWIRKSETSRASRRGPGSVN